MKRHPLRKMKICHILIASAFVCSAQALPLEDGFVCPPHEAKPQTWYHLMNGNVTKEGVTVDFEALAKAGIGGVQMFDCGMGMPEGPLKFNTDEWFDLLGHAHREAKRLHLDLGLANCSGWSSAGGPWNSPSNSMKYVVHTETTVRGPSSFAGVLPRVKEDSGFYKDIAVLAYPRPQGGAKLESLGRKIFDSRDMTGPHPDRDKDDFTGRTEDVFSPAQKVSAAREIDLTSRMAPDGSLTWEVPPGEWTILRIGYRSNGHRNGPASAAGCGLETDKLDGDALAFHFDAYVGRVCKALGVSAETDNTFGFNNVLLDSYEAGCLNWTHGFGEKFKNRFGYSCIPYLPVIAGRIVGSAEESERFLEDYRRLIGELFSGTYGRRFAELCHENGLLFASEPYGNCPCDDLDYGEASDIPMGEFWTHKWDTAGNAKLAASLAHVWGRRFVGAESFTAPCFWGHGRWLETPWTLKWQSDQAFAVGVNRIFYHRFVHQPWAGADYAPGMTMGDYGMHFDRKQTWWRHVNVWLDYQARCQWMLQQGTFQADVLLWSGEKVPNDNLWWGPGVPDGYGWDVASTRALMKLRVENGRVVAPGGVSYALLALPDTDTMSHGALIKIRELLAAGAKVCAMRRPNRHSGLVGWPGADGEVAKLADDVWKKGVIHGSPTNALQKLSVAPDFMSDCDDERVVWNHRADGRADWYFVAADNVRARHITVSLRQEGRVPELWNPETGVREDASVWRVEKGRTTVELDFPPRGSTFIVFRRPSEGVSHIVAASVGTRAAKQEARTQKLEIRKAEYGALVRSGKDDLERSDFQPGAKDVTEILRAAIKGGRLDISAGDKSFGNPAPGQIKFCRVTYALDGVERTEDFHLTGRIVLPRPLPLVVDENASKTGNDYRRSLQTGYAPVPDWEWSAGRLVAWRPLEASQTDASSGAKRAVTLSPPEPVKLKGAWDVSFVDGRGAPEKTRFDALMPWNHHVDSAIKFYSGSAVYAKTVTMEKEEWLKNGGRLMLDLGEVHDFAVVRVNGKEVATLWRPPFAADITGAVAPGAKSFRLEVEVTNRWSNRFIGDELLHDADCEWTAVNPKNASERRIARIPDWVTKGEKSPTGRRAFSTWRHWRHDDRLLDSGLVGPVYIRFGQECGR